MATGIILPSLLTLTASTAEALAFGQTPTLTNILNLPTGVWTPPQYSRPALTIITAPATSSGTSGNPSSSQINYVFDAVFKVTHRRTVHKTSHPVLTGANITDHAYAEPVRVTLEIGMSDSMSSYQDGVWVGSSTKSISAWQILKTLQLNRQPLVLTTRLDTYSNMLITEVSTSDDNKTLHALKATITLEELLIASVQSITDVSSRPQTTGTTPGGTIQAVPPNPSIEQQNFIPSPLYPNTPTYPTVPGSGTGSSNGLNQVFTGATGHPTGGG